MCIRHTFVTVCPLYYIIMNKYVNRPEQVIKSYVKYMIIDSRYKANVYICEILLTMCRHKALRGYFHNIFISTF